MKHDEMRIYENTPLFNSIMDLCWVRKEIVNHGFNENRHEGRLYSECRLIDKQTGEQVGWWVCSSEAKANSDSEYDDQVYLSIDKHIVNKLLKEEE